MSRSFGHPVATCCDMVGGVGSSLKMANNSQHVETRRNRVTQCVQHVVPNNGAICCVDMLRSFGRGLTNICTQATSRKFCPGQSAIMAEEFPWFKLGFEFLNTEKSSSVKESQNEAPVPKLTGRFARNSDRPKPFRPNWKTIRPNKKVDSPGLKVDAPGIFLT